jgi:hypothetical protein
MSHPDDVEERIRSALLMSKKYASLIKAEAWAKPPKDRSPADYEWIKPEPEVNEWLMLRSGLCTSALNKYSGRLVCCVPLTEDNIEKAILLILKIRGHFFPANWGIKEQNEMFFSKVVALFEAELMGTSTTYMEKPGEAIRFLDLLWRYIMEANKRTRTQSPTPSSPSSPNPRSVSSLSLPIVPT